MSGSIFQLWLFIPFTALAGVEWMGGSPDGIVTYVETAPPGCDGPGILEIKWALHVV